MKTQKNSSRRYFFQQSFHAALAASAIGPSLGFSNRRKLTLEFLTIPDPDGWHPSLRLKGDWLIFKISDGVLAGYGEASHSKQDKSCRRVAEQLFKERIASFHPTLDSLNELE